MSSKIITGNKLEKCFIDKLLKANNDILLIAEGKIVETLKLKYVEYSTFANKLAVQKNPLMFKSASRSQ